MTDGPTKKTLEKAGKSPEQQGFESVEAVTRHDNPVVRFFLAMTNRIFQAGRAQPQDWVGNAEWAQLNQNPIRARALLYGVVLGVILLLLWAALAELDEVTRGEGRVVPSSRLQVVQSQDGGVVVDTLVQEGDIVEAGDILMRLDTIRSSASLQETRVQALALQARIDRLEALIEGKAFQKSEFLAGEIPSIIQREKELYRESQREFQERIAIHDEQSKQRISEKEEAQARLQQTEIELRLASRELQATRPLLRSGAVSEIDIIRLERDVNRAQGETEQTRSRLELLEAAIAEAERRTAEAELTFKNRWRTELSEAMAKFASLDQGSQRLANIVLSAEVRAPMRGVVQRLFFSTIGGVVSPGREVAEIVPLDDYLLVEARIPPQDVAFLRPGLHATIKLSAYDFTVFGGLKATVEHISADSITDDKGNTFYIVRLTTTEKGLGEDLPIIPGMTAQVDIVTGKRTVLKYILKPILRAKSNALGER